MKLFLFIFAVVIFSASVVSCNAPNETDVENDATLPASSPEISSLLDGQEQVFLGLINSYRAQNGAGALALSTILTQCARWMSEDMGTKNYFDHTDSLGRDPFTRMKDFGYNFSTAEAENIAAGNADAQNTFTQWKNSPGHNANMLNPVFKVIGIGRAKAPGSDFGWYWTNNFGAAR